MLDLWDQSPISVAVWWSLTFFLTNGHVLTVCMWRGKERDLWSLSVFMRTPVLSDQDPILRTSLNLSCFLKALSPNTLTWGGHIHFITLLNLWALSQWRSIQSPVGIQCSISLRIGADALDPRLKCFPSYFPFWFELTHLDLDIPSREHPACLPCLQGGRKESWSDESGGGELKGRKGAHTKETGLAEVLRQVAIAEASKAFEGFTVHVSKLPKMKALGQFVLKEIRLRGDLRVDHERKREDITPFILSFIQKVNIWVLPCARHTVLVLRIKQLTK